MAQSLNSPFIEYARQDFSVEQVMEIESCSRGTAATRLEEAQDWLACEKEHDGIGAAVDLLLRSSLTGSVSFSAGQPVLGKKRWPEVCLGLRRAA